MDTATIYPSDKSEDYDIFLNKSFAFLVGTTLAVFLLGNILLLSPTALAASTKVLGISLGCLAIIYCCIKLSRDLAFAIVGLYLILALPVITQFESICILFYGAVTGSIVFIFRNKNWQAIFHYNFNLETAKMSAAGAITILGVRSYTSFDMLERASEGNLHQDTIYHASLASMLKNYGITSTGLNGIVETPYHIFSHILHGSISLLSNVSVLETYGAASSLLFSPLLIFIIVFMANQVGHGKSTPADVLWLRCCLILTILPALFWEWRFRNYYFTSESYLVSLTILLACLTPLLRARITTIEWLIIPLGSYFMSQAKASVGGIYALLWLVSIFLVKGRKIQKVVLMTCLVIICVYLGLASAAAANQDDYIKFELLHFIRSSSLGGLYLTSVGDALKMRMIPSPLHLILGFLALVSFLAFHFLPSWIFMIAKTRDLGRLSSSNSRAIAFVLASTAVGIVISFVLRIPGNSVYYFSNIPAFICIPFLLQPCDQALPWRSLVPTLSRSHGLILLLLLFCLPGLSANSRLEIIHHHHNHLSPWLQTMINIRQSSPKDVVLIGSEQLRDENPIHRFSARPLIFPALSERPWINVIERQHWCLYDYLGYSEYGVSSSHCTGLGSPQIPPGFTLRSWPSG
jgi:hypothetical protein